ncbi:MAG: hypothetical protein KatS3mg103_0438 [Phycisphaerales bacterium]|nr:MAG: hypothetical protein KatS3mg103_0438 [Phycisphaerales bacterium]
MPHQPPHRAVLGRGSRAAAVAWAMACCTCAWAQSGSSPAPAPAATPPPAGQTVEAVAGERPERTTLRRMMTPITARFENTPLREVFAYLAQQTGAQIDVLWTDERTGQGLDPEQAITLAVKDLPALTVLERVLAKAEDALGSGNNWQLTEWGEIQAGPTSRLNRFNRTEIYDINDLLLTLPSYPDVPQIDLQQALQSNQGGGGQSPFQDTGNNEIEEPPLDERVDEIINLIEELVEPDHWIENPRASIRYFKGTLIVRAPDYVHRALAGYPYWPTRRIVATVEGRRYVTMGIDTGLSTIDGFGRQPVSAVVGGRIVSSDPGNPGGGG